MGVWQMQDAKARLSEVVKRAQSEGPQEITLHGQPVAVVLSRAAYSRMSGQQRSLVEFMQNSPWAQLSDEELPLERDTSSSRSLDL